MFHGTVECDASLPECVGHALLWLILCIITFGLGVFVYPYALARFVVNRCWLVENGHRVGRFECDLHLGGQIGHFLLWIVLAVLTFGLAYFIYLYRIGVLVARRTRVVPL